MSSSFFSSVWQRYLNSGFPDTTSEETLQQVRFVNSFSLIGLMSFLIFGTLQIVQGAEFQGYVELAFAVFAILNLISLRIWHRVTLAASMVLFLMVIVLSFLIITGGIGNTGLFWIFTFPVLAFFLKGTKKGIVWVLVFILVCAGVFLVQSIFHIGVSHPWLTIRQLLMSFIAVSGLVYFYQTINESNQDVIKRRTDSLVVITENLEEQVIQKQRSQQSLTHSVQEMNAKNKELEDTKKAMLNVLDDLTLAQHASEKARVKDEALLTSIGEGLAATDEQGRVIMINQSAERMLGYTREEVIGKRWAVELPKVQDEQGKTIAPESLALYKSFSSGERSVSNYSYLRKDGTPLPVAVTAAPVILNNVVIGGIVVFRDVTKEREVDRAKSEFVSLASHQLRTPLSTINWYVEMLLDGDAGPITDEQKKYLNEVYHGNQRMVELVNALLNVSRIDLGTFAVEPEPTNLQELAESLLKELTPQITAKQTVVTSFYSPDLPIIHADPKLLRIVLQNLMTNAIKYTPEKGSITLKIIRKDPDILLTVADTGYGVPKNQAGKIFTKLFRADNVREQETDGTGLGLYIVKSIVEQSGGKVWFESEENKGTTFFVTLPLSGMKKKEGAKGLTY